MIMTWKTLCFVLPSFAAWVHCNPAPPVAPVATQGFTKCKISPLAAPAFEAAGAPIAPYLVTLTPTMAKIAWRTATPVVSTLKLWEADRLLQTIPSPEGYQHEAVLEGLQPHTEYRYEVDGSPQVRLRTLTAAPERRFALLGHTHGTEHVGHFPDEFLASRIRDWKPDFVAHAGDCVYYSTPADWGQHFFGLFEEVLAHAPIYVSPGNHDCGWPFLNGYDLRCFRELFPEAYPEAVGSGPEQAFYQVAQGPVDLYFLSYVADMSPGSVQVSWLKKELAVSTADYRVVVFGGMNRYYDEDAFFADMQGHGIDLVVNGDGAAPAQVMSQPHGIRRLSLGTASKGAHPWVACEATPDSLKLRVMFADGRGGDTFWIHQPKTYPVLVRLEEPRVFPNKNEVVFRYNLPTPIDSNRVGGLQFVPQGMSSGSGVCFAAFGPSKSLGGGEFGLRSAYVSYLASDGQITIGSLAQDPIQNAPYQLAGVEVRFMGPPDSLPKSLNAWLFERKP